MTKGLDPETFKRKFLSQSYIYIYSQNEEEQITMFLLRHCSIATSLYEVMRDKRATFGHKKNEKQGWFIHGHGHIRNHNEICMIPPVYTANSSDTVCKRGSWCPFYNWRTLTQTFTPKTSFQDSWHSKCWLQTCGMVVRKVTIHCSMKFCKL